MSWACVGYCWPKQHTAYPMTLKEAARAIRNGCIVTLRNGDQWCSIQPITDDDRVVWITGTGRTADPAPYDVSSAGFACCEVQTMLSNGWSAVQK